MHERGGVRFAYHPSSRDRVRPLIESAERVRQSLRSELSQPVLGNVDVRVAMTQADFARIMPQQPRPEGRASRQGTPWGAETRHPVVAFAELSLLVMNLGASADGAAPDATEAFRHGLAHLALDEATGSQVVPKWFHEGYATRFGDETSWGRASALGWASVRRALAPLRDLDWYLSDAAGQEALGGAQAADFVGFLLAGDRTGRFSHLVLKLKGGEPYQRALRGAYRADQRQLERAWRRDLAWRTVFLPVLLGGVLLAILGALGWRLRERWRRSRAALRRRDVAQPVAAIRRRPPKIQVVRAVRPLAQPPKDDVPLGEPPDSGVPKVSHGGEWHTLH